LPYGYREAEDDVLGPDPSTGEIAILTRRGDVVVDPEAARVVRRIFALHADGLSAEAIADEHALAGIRTSRVGAFGLGSVQQILRHERLYRTGIRVWGGIAARSAGVRSVWASRYPSGDNS
jgi:Recombinase